MQLLKLTACSLLCFVLASSLVSCEKDAEKDKVTEYFKTEIPMTGAQETPAVPSAATGTLNVSYSKATRILNYTIKWAGLSDTITGIYLHGVAPTGYAAPTVQSILTSKNEVAYPFRGGSYTGNLFVDGFKVKEEDVLNHLFYINIRTKTYASGEIRAQVRFQ